MIATRDMTTLVLFDIDGTLSESRKTITPKLRECISKLRQKVFVGVVGGSDFEKQKEQLGTTVLEDYDYVFSENGLVAHKNASVIGKNSIKDFLGEDKLKKFINFTLHKLADIDIPKKRGTFIEFRTGMLNISPIGRNCSYEERLEFNKFDEEHHIREKLIKDLQAEFNNYDLKFSIGGQISIDVFPNGWDKTYCLRYVEKEFKTIHFFGDKTMPGGNDYEIFSDKRVIGHTVLNPEDTQKTLSSLFHL